MSMDKKEILYWCDSVENTWKPREDVPRGENPQLIPESFLATAIRYLRALCDHNEVASKAGDVCGKCLEGKIQHTSFMKENGEITIHVYGCNRCCYGWSEEECNELNQRISASLSLHIQNQS